MFSIHKRLLVGTGNIMADGKTIGIISLKGGVGKTSSVANLGAALASEFGRKVLVVDANFSAPNLGLHLGLINPKITIHDVLLGRCKAEDAVHEHKAGFHLIPGAYVSRKVRPSALNDRISHLKERYDDIVIDSSPNLNEEMLATMMASDELLVITSPDYPTLSATLRAVRLARQKRTPITGIVLNKVRGKKFELRTEDIEHAAQVPVIGVLPEDINMLESVSVATPLVLHKGRSDAAIAYKKLAARLIGREYRDPRLLQRLKSVLGMGPREK